MSLTAQGDAYHRRAVADAGVAGGYEARVVDGLYGVRLEDGRDLSVLEGIAGAGRRNNRRLGGRAREVEHAATGGESERDRGDPLAS